MMATPWPMTLQSGAGTLYHYQPPKLEWLERTLVEGVIHCSKPMDFNDPWDCRPSFNTEALNDPDYRERQVRWFDALGRKTNPLLLEDEHARRANTLREDRAFLGRLIAESSAGMEQPINDRYRVFCLTTKPDCPLMWAHYAEKHRGICLGFTTRNEVFSGALRVDYAEMYPVFELADDSEAGNLRALLTKSSVWRYEDEYRLIAQERSAATDHETLITNDNYLALPSGALSSIIVGCLMPAETIAEIRAIVERSETRPAIHQMVRDPNRYKLGMTSIDGGASPSHTTFNEQTFAG